MQLTKLKTSFKARVLGGRTVSRRKAGRPANNAADRTRNKTVSGFGWKLTVGSNQLAELKSRSRDVQSNSQELEFGGFGELSFLAISDAARDLQRKVRKHIPNPAHKLGFRV